LHGWLGHEARTPELDRELERVLGYFHRRDGAAAFIISAYGRHLGDNIAGCRTLAEQKDAIAKAVSGRKTLRAIREHVKTLERKESR
jgi:hypothetical protein